MPVRCRTTIRVSGRGRGYGGDLRWLFANEYGEQAIYPYDYDTGVATLRMDDAGWRDVRRVVDGQAEGFVLSQTEALWLRACWLATGGLEERPTPSTTDASRRG